MTKGDENFLKLEQWIKAQCNPDGTVKRDSNGDFDVTNIKFNNNEGTINRTWLAKELKFYDRSALKTVRASNALKNFEQALGLVTPYGTKQPRETVAKSELERIKAEKEKIATRLLLVSAELKSTQKELKARIKQLDQFEEIRRIQIETGRNIVGIGISILKFQKEAE
jgi:hypothetical protein